METAVFFGQDRSVVVDLLRYPNDTRISSTLDLNSNIDFSFAVLILARCCIFLMSI
jgi:hypothetical protein